jgi:hypothetical protein
VLPVEVVADLRLAEPAGAAGRTHIAAASALAIVGDNVYVIADDELYLAIFPETGRAKGLAVPLLSGHLPNDDDARSEEKADLESLTPLAGFEGYPHGGLIALGSGSTPIRRRGAFAAFSESGSISETFELDARPLMEWLDANVPGLNLEGSAVSRDRLRLFQRGNEDDSLNAHIDLDLEALCTAVGGDRILTGAIVRDVVEHDLGHIRGVRLCFSDADTLPDGRVVFSASAEVDGDGRDGASVGSAVGVMSPAGEVLRLEPVDLEIKAEGLAARPVRDGVEAFMVTDQDDPEVPSRLLRVLLIDPDRDRVPGRDAQSEGEISAS